ncbi:MAG: heavy metal translocating P-type ATPase [Chloroflexota bacterium]
MTSFGLIAAAGLLVVGGRKLVALSARRRKTPHIQILKGINDEHGQTKSAVIPINRELMPQRVTTAVTRRVRTIQHFKTQTFDPLFEDKRTEHLKEISLDENVLSEEEKLANMRLVMASIFMVSTTASLIIYPPLLFLHIPPFVWLNIPLFQEAYHDLIQKRRATTVVVDALTVLWALVYSPFSPQILVVGAASEWLYSYTYKIGTRTKDGTRKQLTNLAGEQPKTVWLLQDDIEVEVPLESLQANDLVVIEAGQMIPVDGQIDQGVATIDQNLLTGEAQPIEKGIGDPVFAATVMLSGRIIIQVQKTGQETAVAQVGQMLVETTDFASSVEMRGKELADRAALPTVLLSGAALPFLGPSKALGILFSGIGANMKLLGPMSVLNYLQRNAHQGILIKDGRALEQVINVDTVVFDKTGTLTLEQPNVRQIHILNQIDEETLLTYAAAAEQRQTHPIAKAILQAAEERQIAPLTICDSAYEVGYGIRVTVDEQLIRVGSRRYMEMEEVTLPEPTRQIAQDAHQQGHSVVYLAVNEDLAGVIELQPTIRPEAKRIVEYLQARGIETYIISGDQEGPTRELAKQMEVAHYFAETRPEQKANHIARLQKDGKFVCFIGDGINDAIALKQANLSISLCGATTIATDTAQVIMMDETLHHLPTLFEEAEAFEANMQANLVTTVIPGVVIIGLSLVGAIDYVASAGIFLTGLSAGVVNAMIPRLAMRHINTDKNDVVEP